MQNQMTLGHRDAIVIVERLRGELEEQGRGAAVAVCDAHGELLAFVRTDGCPLPSIDVAVNKAFTAARQRTHSDALGEAATEGRYPTSNFGGLRYIGWGGGVPIVHNNEVVGAVGVSGLTEPEDARYAELGAGLLVASAGSEPA